MKSLQNLFYCLVLVSATFIWSCQKTEDPNQDQPYVEYDPKLPQEWMQFSYNAVKAQGWFALDASRLYAYSAITAYESMVHSLPNGKSLAGQLHDLHSLPQPKSGTSYDYGIVLCHAMPQILAEMMPDMVTQTKLDMADLSSRQESELSRSHNLSAKTIADSKAFADDLVEAIIDWSRQDRRSILHTYQYIVPSRVGNPQYWDGTTLGQNFMQPFWWVSRPFVSQHNLCEVDPPYPYSTAPNSTYYKDVKEVYDASFDQAKVDIGKYWANNPGVSGTPAGSWLGIANQLVDQYQLDLATTLKMYVLLAIGTRDTFISVWYMKYKYNLERPVSFIRNVMGHTTWSSPVPTPPYPDYTSGTSANAGVSSETLTRLFGAKSFSDAQHIDKGFGTKQFANFKAAGSDAYHSRIYGGVHMRRACELGFAQGECLADYIWNNLAFEK